MVICVYGSASEKIDEKYKTACFDLCKELALRGHDLIYGAGSKGIMGTSARGFRAGGGKVHGVIPKFFEEEKYEGIFYEADELTFTENMAERKTAMEDGCNAFIIAPGGCGTFEEFFEALTLKQLGRHKKAIVIYNCFGYYDKLKEMLEYSYGKKFINQECRELYAFFDDPKEIIKYIENYSTGKIVWSRLKRD